MAVFKNPIAEEIWDMKYRLKHFDGTPVDHTVQDTWRRVAKSLSSVEVDKEYWEEVFYKTLESFKFIPAGRINAGAGTDRNVTLFNCFVMGTIPDSLGGIFKQLSEAAITMQQGGGIGYDFSTIRPQGAEVKGVSSEASGPLTFMDVWDAACKTIMSAGVRRGAMMATMRCDHPDIEKFIDAKRDPNRLRMFNLSVLVTDGFMEAVENDENFDLVFEGKVYKTIRARSLWDKITLSTYHYAEPGVIFIDRINRDNNLRYMETIASCNPCVHPDTPILTRNGYLLIGEREGYEVEVWNGEEFSKVWVKETGRDQPMKTVNFSDGSSLTCTHYHPFYLNDGTKVEAKDLKEGDKLLKNSWPVCEPTDEFDSIFTDTSQAYEMGFFSGDGWVKGEDKVYIGLYGEKKKLLSNFKNYKSCNEYPISGGFEGTDTTQTKLYLYYGKRNWSKTFVPKENWTVEAKKAWFRGLIDSDGYITKDGNAQISSKDRNFLEWVKLLLNELGSTGTLSEMKDHWRLSIPASYYYKMGIGGRHKAVKPQREATRFVFVTSVEEDEVAEKVYCFTEPKRGMGIFGGVLTGQCGEQPLPPYGACLLGSINLVAMLHDDYSLNEKALVDTVSVAVRMLDNVVDVSKFPLPAQQTEAYSKRRIGLGVTGLADVLALSGINYGSDEAVEFTNTIMEKIANIAYRTSALLANEKGVFPAYEPYLFQQSNFYDRLSEETKEYVQHYGLRNSHLLSVAPTGTISLYAGNVSSGIEPIFALEYDRHVLQKDGSKVTQTVQDYGVLKWNRENLTPLPSSFVTTADLVPEDHIRIQAAAQYWVDSSISKTINVPEDISFEDFKEVYTFAWRTGCKGCTTYRPNDVTGSVLSVKKEKEEFESAACELKYDENTGQMLRTCE